MIKSMSVGIITLLINALLCLFLRWADVSHMGFLFFNAVFVMYLLCRLFRLETKRKMHAYWWGILWSVLCIEAYVFWYVCRGAVDWETDLIDLLFWQAWLFAFYVIPYLLAIFILWFANPKKRKGE